MSREDVIISRTMLAETNKNIFVFHAIIDGSKLKKRLFSMVMKILGHVFLASRSQLHLNKNCTSCGISNPYFVVNLLFHKIRQKVGLTFSLLFKLLSITTNLLAITF